MIEIYKPTISELKLSQVYKYMWLRDSKPEGELLMRVEAAYPAFLRLIKPIVCFMLVDVNLFADHKVELGPLTVHSADLSRLLTGCQRAILMAGTVGAEVDRARVRAQALSSVDGLIYDAFGTEAIEETCDLFCDEMEKRFGELTFRYAPGYGDLPLEMQSELLHLLDTKRKIGMGLMDSLLMTPTKSVSAIIGIKDRG